MDNRKLQALEWEHENFYDLKEVKSECDVVLAVIKYRHFMAEIDLSGLDNDNVTYTITMCESYRAAEYDESGDRVYIERDLGDELRALHVGIDERISAEYRARQKRQSYAV